MNEMIKEMNAVEDAFINAAATFKNKLISIVKKYGKVKYNPPGTPEPDYVIDKADNEPEKEVTMTVDEELVCVDKVSVYISDIYINDTILVDNTDEYTCVAEFLRNNINED